MLIYFFDSYSGRSTFKNSLIATMFLAGLLSLNACKTAGLNDTERDGKQHRDPASRAEVSVQGLKDLYFSLEDKQQAQSMLDQAVDTPLETPAKRNYLKAKSRWEQAQESLAQAQANVQMQVDAGALLPSQAVDIASWPEPRVDKLVIPSIKALKKGKIKNFLLAPSSFSHYGVELVNYAYSEKKIALPDDESSKNFFQVSLKCDGKFTVQQNSNLFKDPSDVTKATFNLYDSKTNGQKTIFYPSAEVTQCEMQFQDKYYLGRKKEIIRFERVDKKFPVLAQLMNTIEVCPTPKGTEGDVQNLSQFFYTNKYGSMTCANTISSAKVLAEGIDGIAAKAEVLLGQKLPKNFIENGDPFAPLDFSKAPQFDGIVLSYLVFRSDFSGTLLARLLDFHARGMKNKFGKEIRKGTPVFIHVSDVIQLPKDKTMLQELALRNGNVKLIEYRWKNSSQTGEGSWIDPFHRTNHVKIFATISEKTPADNVVIIGGRNVHDGFVFKNPVFSIYPAMVQYGEGKDESWAVWRDFEAQFTSDSFARQIFRQYFHLYYKNPETLQVGSPSVVVPLSESQWSVQASSFPTKIDFSENKFWLRHFVSVPFKDGQVLTDLYADMIRAAKKKILISSPYFRPTIALQKAIEDAIDRGVEVKLITRINLKGDTFGGIASDVNKQGVNMFVGKMKMYEYAEPNEILHSKLLLIDDEFTFIGGVNLNQRSFAHDIENGLLIGSQVFNQAVTLLYNSYLPQCKEITQEKKIKLWHQWIIDGLGNRL